MTTETSDVLVTPEVKAMIGRKVDEEIEVMAPAGDKFYVVKKIEFI